MYQPLADLLRPTNLDQVFGQDHILAPGGVLRRLIESGKVPNMVFYGPSGTGKTTVANIIAEQTNRTLFKLNATTASTADFNMFRRYFHSMLEQGVYVAPSPFETGFISTAHTEADIDATVAAMRRALQSLR